MQKTIEKTLMQVNANLNLQINLMENDLRTIKINSDWILESKKYHEIGNVTFFCREVNDRWIRIQELRNQKRDLETLLEELKGRDLDAPENAVVMSDEKPTASDFQGLPLFSSDRCVNCGGSMEGDGYSLVYHCALFDDITGLTPDEGPIYCNFENLEGDDLC